jgi:arginine metabolism regulation protein II
VHERVLFNVYGWLIHILEHSRVSMGAVLNKGLFSGSIDSTIEEIDARSCGPSASPFNDIRIGPFAVLNFNGVDQEVCDLPPGGVSNLNPIAEPPTDGVLPPVRGSPLPTGLPEFTDDLLQWSDIFGLNDDLYGITSNFPFNLTSYPDFSAHPDWSTYGDTTYNLSTPTILDSNTEILLMPPGGLGRDFMSIPQTLPATTTTTSNSTASVDILGDAPFLLHIFQRHVVPQLTIVPFGKKASWNMMNLPAALITLGDLTILESQEVSHARLANLYSLLTCAAVFLAKKPSNESDGDCQFAHWHQVASKSYQEAKDHTIIYMKEPLGVPKAKYKDRTMAICGMIEAAVSDCCIV